MNVTVLVDFANDSVRTALEVAEALGERPVGRAPGHLREARGPGAAAPARRRRPRASRPSSSRSREPLDARGHRDVRIVVSGGFDAERIREFEAAGVPVDAYGVGSWLLRGANDFTADMVMVDGGRAGRSGASCAPTTASAPSARDERHEAHALEPRRAQLAALLAQQREVLVAVLLDRGDSRPPGASCATSAGGTRRAPPRRR